MLSTLMFAFMLHLYCDEPTQNVKKTPTVKKAPAEVSEIPKAEAREIPKVPRSTKALLRPAKSTIPKVPRSARAALK